MKQLLVTTIILVTFINLVFFNCAGLRTAKKIEEKKHKRVLPSGYIAFGIYKGSQQNVDNLLGFGNDDDNETKNHKICTGRKDEVFLQNIKKVNIKEKRKKKLEDTGEKSKEKEDQPKNKDDSTLEVKGGREEEELEEVDVPKYVMEINIKDEFSLDANAKLPFGLSLPIDTKAGIEGKIVTSIKLLLINPKEIRLLNPKLNEKVIKEKSKLKGKECMTSILQVEKIKIEISTKNQGSVEVGTQQYEVKLATEANAESTREADNVYVGYKSELLFTNTKEVAKESALFPGLGQFRKSEYGKGVLYSGGFILAGLYTLNSLNIYNTKKQEYNTAKNIDTVFNIGMPTPSPLGFFTYSQASAYSGEVNLAGNKVRYGILSMMGLYVFNIIDAMYLEGDLFTSYTNGFQFYYSPNNWNKLNSYNPNYEFIYTWSF